MNDLKPMLLKMPGNLYDEVEALRREVETLKRAMITPETTTLNYVVEAAFDLSGLADNTATTVFSIITTNEDGSNDGGAYACHVQAVIGHGISPTTSNGAAKSFAAHFGRVQKSGGTGETTAVSEISETASAANTSATRDIGTVTMSVSEASEYQVDVQFTVDLTGSSLSTGRIAVFVRVVWAGYETAPQIVQV